MNQSENPCKICESSERAKIEDDFFAGERSEYLISQDVKTNISSILFHMKEHTHRGNLITNLITQRDEQIKKYLEDVTRLEMNEVTNSLTKTYRELAYISADLLEEYWNLKDQYGEETIKERLVIFSTIEKSLNTLSKSVPEQVFVNKKSNLKDIIVESRKIIESIRNKS